MSRQPRNAADAERVEKDAEAEKLRRDNELAELKGLLRLPEFRRFMWRMLGWTKFNGRNLWSPGAEIHKNAAMRDLGREIFGELEEADQEAVFRMMREAKGEQK